jgi:hypothetical protein
MGGMRDPLVAQAHDNVLTALWAPSFGAIGRGYADKIANVANSAVNQNPFK